MSFWAYDTSKNLILALTPQRKSQSLSTAELAAAGFLSAVPTTLITAPVERAKTQGQGKELNERKYKGVIDVVKHLYREGGLRSLYRGTGATLARDGPGSAAYFAAYEVTKKVLTPAGSSPSELNLGAIIVAGGSAGIAMWALAIPPDVLKSRLQSAPEGTYSGMLDCARKTIAQDGVRALWKGFGPAMARAFPANAATFASYTDLPIDIKPDVDGIFDISGRLPIAWTDKGALFYLFATAPVASKYGRCSDPHPDCAILIPAATIRSLSLSAKSPFKVLKGHSTVVKSGNTSKGSSFRYQSTPCATLPDTPGFEFASSFWEDKKPVHHLLEDAYRQNRMSTASALRHMNSLAIKAPVVGLVWSSGIVRAHVDWCKAGEDVMPTILSAPYPGDSAAGEDMFREWQLDQPGDILAIYFLIRNLDRWTNGGFYTRVAEGIKDLVDRVVNKGERYTPWKRVGELLPLLLASKENIVISATSTLETSLSTPVRSRQKRRRARLS
ncbi:hypothetical protein C0991_005135 [Blastosporella zonata]|nr:hypothetical protein C0991_005135 [Blastosporella zonata]